MATFNGTPIPLGQVQTSYSDQMATALEGQLVSESDINMTDSVLVSSAANIVCGRGVIQTITTTGTRAGVNDTQISLPTISSAATDFAGIVVRPKSAFSSGSNVAEIRSGFGAMILDPKRVGGRIWVKCYKGASSGGTVYWRVGNSVVGDPTPVGAFSGAAISGTYTGALASGTLLFNANPADGDTVTINCGSSVQYRFKTTIAAQNDIKLDTTLALTIGHFVTALDQTGVSGTGATADYYTGTAGLVNAAGVVTSAGLVTITALAVGTTANSYTLAVSNASATTGVTKSAATLLGGVAASVATDTVALTNAIWKTTATDGQIAKLQIGQ